MRFLSYSIREGPLLPVPCIPLQFPVDSFAHPFLLTFYIGSLQLLLRFFSQRAKERTKSLLYFKGQGTAYSILTFVYWAATRFPGTAGPLNSSSQHLAISGTAQHHVKESIVLIGKDLRQKEKGDESALTIVTAERKRRGERFYLSSV